MSFFVTITFDLSYATMSPHGNNVYSKITEELNSLCYFKNYKKSSRTSLPLPANTYIAEFENNGETTKDIIKIVKRELRKVLRGFDVNGKYFISVGEKTEVIVEHFT